MITNKVRIIGGRWKRCLIEFESIEGLRPTPDRIRETLFNWLMWDLAGKTVLDLCAGSGVLGFEALSRGAAHCIFIEANAKQSQRLVQAAQQLDCVAQITMIASRAELATAQIDRKIDVLFLDPPYASQLWASLAHLYNEYLQDEALIYVEANQAQETLGLPRHWECIKQTQAGEVRAGLWVHRAQRDTKNQINHGTIHT